MSDVRTLDIRLLDEAFEMQSGYGLGFSDRTMNDFFLEELNIDIDDPTDARGHIKGQAASLFLAFLRGIVGPTY